MVPPGHPEAAAVITNTLMPIVSHLTTCSFVLLDFTVYSCRGVATVTSVKQFRLNTLAGVGTFLIILFFFLSRSP